jgi:hypothetical protein
MHATFWQGNLKERGHLLDLGIDGEGNIKRDLKEIGWDNVDGIYVAHDRNQW